jgi:hypothetical protein
MFYLLVISFNVFNNKFYYYMALIIVLFVLLASLSISTGCYCIGAESDRTDTLKINKGCTIMYDIESWVKK